MTLGSPPPLPSSLPPSLSSSPTTQPGILFPSVLPVLSDQLLLEFWLTVTSDLYPTLVQQKSWNADCPGVRHFPSLNHHDCDYPGLGYKSMTGG